MFAGLQALYNVMVKAATALNTKRWDLEKKKVAWRLNSFRGISVSTAQKMILSGLVMIAMRREWYIDNSPDSKDQKGRSSQYG